MYLGIFTYEILDFERINKCIIRFIIGMYWFYILFRVEDIEQEFWRKVFF